MQITPLVYLKRELGFNLSEWQKLPEADQVQLKTWAEYEMLETKLVETIMQPIPGEVIR